MHFSRDHEGNLVGEGSRVVRLVTRANNASRGIRIAGHEADVTLSRRSIMMLLDLIDNKCSTMAVVDREDAATLAALESARRELSKTRDVLQSVAKCQTPARSEGTG